MSLEQLNDGYCKTYLLTADGTQEAILVDPVLEHVDAYLERLQRAGLTLTAVIDTHVHADHISGGAALRDRTGCDYVMHGLSAAPCANRRVADGDTIRLGDLELGVLHTPGHTQDSITLVLPEALLTGDFLFIGEGGAGRTDLPGGDPGDHWDSLQKLARFSSATRVLPAHDYHGRSGSTLGEERQRNERLRPRTREAYVEWLDGLRLGPAEWMASVIQANYACATDPRAAWIPADQPSCEVKGTRGSVNAEMVRGISAESLARALEAEPPPMIVDVREPDEFAGPLGHIPGARLVPLGTLTRRLEELGPVGAPVVTVCKGGGRSATAAAVLTVSGFRDVRSLEGGMLRWSALGLPAVRDAGASGAAPT